MMIVDLRHLPPVQRMQVFRFLLSIRPICLSVWLGPAK